MERESILLVLVEPGARLPDAVGEERRARPENVVIVAGGTLRVDEFAFRAMDRVAGLHAAGRVIDQAVLVALPGRGHPSRTLLAKTLAARLAAAADSELVLTADRPANASTRQALLELAGELLGMPDGPGISIRVQLGGGQADSGVWSRVDGAPVARVA